jgi:hypothetical protein|eukprot:COSAG01_NODE_1575_length_9856_cov_33.989956_2_plen_103_part_00
MDDITGVGTHRVAAPEARAREGPARPFPPSIFLDKNRRDIGKSQVNGPIPRWKRSAHTRGAAAAAAAADADATSLRRNGCQPANARAGAGEDNNHGIDHHQS